MSCFTMEEQTAFNGFTDKSCYTSNVKEEVKIPMSKHCDLYSFGLIAQQICGISRCSLTNDDHLYFF